MRFRQAGNVSIADEREIVGYQIARGVAVDQITDTIRVLIIDGWQPFGSLCIGGSSFFQPMVKYKTDDQSVD